LVGETEVLGENLPQCRFVHHKPHMLPVREHLANKISELHGQLIIIVFLQLNNKTIINRELYVLGYNTEQ
jgi:hypothetical protein